MICNPMMHGTAEEKEYTLTRANGAQVKVKAGEIFLLNSTNAPETYVLKTENGVSIPWESSETDPRSRQSPRVPTSYYYFVMPAQNVSEQTGGVG